MDKDKLPAIPQLRYLKFFTFAPGEMAERSNAAVLKTVDPSRGPGVRIPLSPPDDQSIRGFTRDFDFTATHEARFSADM